MILVILIGMTCRTVFIGREFERSLLEKHIGPLYALWHGRIFYLPYIYRWRKRIHCLVSPSIDGEIIARMLRLFGLSVIRGSSYKGGGKAFRELIRVTKRGDPVAIIVDGSRGPAFKVQGGIVHLAMLSGVPVLPITYGAERAIFLNSWDRFLIPKPFSRLVVVYGEPIYISRGASIKEIEEKRRELERRLMEITEKADCYFKD